MKIQMIGAAVVTQDLEITPETTVELLQLIKLSEELRISKIKYSIKQALVSRSIQAGAINNLAMYIPLKGNKNDQNTVS